MRLGIVFHFFPLPTDRMPQVTVPHWSIIPDLLPDAILIGFVSTFLSVSLVKLFSLKYRNKVNFNHVSRNIILRICDFTHSYRYLYVFLSKCTTTLKLGFLDAFQLRIE